MSTYFVRRLLLFIPTLFIVSMLVFLSVRLLPGDFVDILLNDPRYGATDTDRERFREMLGLNVPAHIAYVQWMRGILLEGTLGQSLLRGHKPVEIKILDRVPVTLELGGGALLIGLLIALPVGIYSAVRQDTLGDYAGRSVAIFGLATPNFWLWQQRQAGTGGRRPWASWSSSFPASGGAGRHRCDCLTSARIRWPTSACSSSPA